MRKNTSSAGFTLLELMIAVAIVGILASLATPTLVKYIKKAKTTEARRVAPEDLPPAPGSTTWIRRPCPGRSSRCRPVPASEP